MIAVWQGVASDFVDWLYGVSSEAIAKWSEMVKYWAFI